MLRRDPPHPACFARHPLPQGEREVAERANNDADTSFDVIIIGEGQTDFLPSPLVGEGGRRRRTGEGMRQKVPKQQRAFARTLRANATDAEIALWRLLRSRRLATLKFRRQVPIGAWIVDFVVWSPSPGELRAPPSATRGEGSSGE